MRQILCVVDFGESAGKVLELSAMIATACKAHLLILHPYRLIDNGFQGDIRSLKQKLEAEAKEKFAVLKGRVPQADLSCEFICEIGFMADRIEAHVRKRNIDMIVVGQQQFANVHDTKNFDFRQLIERAKLPLVIVPDRVGAEARI